MAFGSSQLQKEKYLLKNRLTVNWTKTDSHWNADTSIAGQRLMMSQLVEHWHSYSWSTTDTQSAGHSSPQSLYVTCVLILCTYEVHPFVQAGRSTSSLCILCRYVLIAGRKLILVRRYWVCCVRYTVGVHWTLIRRPFILFLFSMAQQPQWVRATSL